MKIIKKKLHPNLNKPRFSIEFANIALFTYTQSCYIFFCLIVAHLVVLTALNSATIFSLYLLFQILSIIRKSSFHLFITFYLINTSQSRSQYLSQASMKVNYGRKSYQIQDNSYGVKQEYSEVFTIKSIDSDQEYIQIVPCYQQTQVSSLNSGRWKSKQHVKYIMFVNYFENIFQNKHNKRLWKIFTVMASFIKTRNSSQCRSHHQKMQRKYQGRMNQIVQKQKQRYKNYGVRFQQLKKILQKIEVQYPQQKFQQANPSVSIKILQEERQLTQNCRSFKKIQTQLKNIKKISLVQIKGYEKENQQYKDKSTKQFIKLNTQQYIGSECSIKMQEESNQDCQDIIQSSYHNIQNNLNQKQQQKQKQMLVKTNDTYTQEKPNYVKKQKNVRTSIISFADNSDQQSQTDRRVSSFKNNGKSNGIKLNFDIRNNQKYSASFEVKSCNQNKQLSCSQYNDSSTSNIPINVSIQDSVWTNFVSNFQEQQGYQNDFRIQQNTLKIYEQIKQGIYSVQQIGECILHFSIQKLRGGSITSNNKDYYAHLALNCKQNKQSQ